MRGYSRIFIKAALALAALALCAAGQTHGYEPDQTAPTGPVLVGSVVHVSDGDTIKVQLSSGPITVRFSFIDAPEWNQPWGPEATAALKARLTGKQVQLAVETQDKYDRLVAVVYLGDENINAWMVKQGNAWAYRQYLENPAYCGWEGHARASKLGLWGVTPANWRAPWDWRHVANGEAAGFTDYSRDTIADCIAAMRPAGSPAQATIPVAPIQTVSTQASARCLIKGNISDNGRIYHVPGSTWYDRTQINTAKGERWFCTEKEALDAGWRAPRN